MHAQVAGGGEGLVADAARVRPLAGVRSKVQVEFGAYEALAAKFADAALLRVFQKVRRQQAFVFERPVAEIARVLRFYVCCGFYVFFG